MGLLDLFRPKWRHTNKGVRLQAIQGLTDQDLLRRIERMDPEPEVRCATTVRLAVVSGGVSAVAELAKRATDEAVRAAAIEQLDKELMTFEVLLGLDLTGFAIDSSSRVTSAQQARMTATAKKEAALVMEALAEISTGDVSPTLREKAAKLLKESSHDLEMTGVRLDSRATPAQPSPEKRAGGEQGGMAPVSFSFVCSGNESLIEAFCGLFRVAEQAGWGKVARYRSEVWGGGLEGAAAAVGEKGLRFAGEKWLGSSRTPVEQMEELLVEFRAAASRIVHVAFVEVGADHSPWVRQVYEELLGQALKQGILPFPMFITNNKEAADFIRASLQSV